MNNKFLEKILLKISKKFITTPRDIQQLQSILKKCANKNIIDEKLLMMMDGVIQTSSIQVRDIMIPRAQMVCIDITKTPIECVDIIKQSKHSRYPVIDNSKDQVLGILLAKDMLIYIGSKKSTSPKLKDLYHKPIFTPESKKIDELLRDFQVQHMHMAIVADEYGGVSGLVTIEDIIEQIVGDIEDEFYKDDDHDNITRFKDNYIIKGKTEIKEINKILKTNLPDEDFDTINGLIINKFGYIPKEKQTMQFDNYVWEITSMDNFCIKSIVAKKII